MVDDTRNCDDVGAYIEKICPELQGAVLVIHTKNNGDISQAASEVRARRNSKSCESSPTKSTPGNPHSKPSSPS
jgi:type III restriction enzyme